MVDCRQWLLWFGLALHAANATPLPDPNFIIQQVLLRDKILQEHRKSFDYDLDEVKQKLDPNQTILSTVEKKSIVVGDRRPEYATREKAGNRSLSSGKEPPFSLLKIIDHFTYDLESIETVNSVSCYRIRFTPKKDQPYRNREEKIMNEVSGEVWASTQDYSLLKNEGTLTRPVPVGWIFATLREMEFRYESQRLPNGDFGPKQITYRYLVSIPFGHIHERIIRSMTRYQLSDSGQPSHFSTALYKMSRPRCIFSCISGRVWR